MSCDLRLYFVAKQVLRILNMTMKVRKPAYSDVIDLDLKLYVPAPCRPREDADTGQLRV